MNTKLPSRLIVDARYTLSAEGDVLLVALNNENRWQLWDVTGGEWIGPSYTTPGETYFETVAAVERDAGL